MAIRSGFFNDVNDDRVYDAKDFADYFASFIGNGVFPTPSTGLQLFENGNMTTVLKAGKAWINGYYVHNDSDHIFIHDMADGLLKRIDRIVAQYSTADRTINILMKKGMLGSNPVAPALLRNADFYELVLADVVISNGLTQITQANIIDQRLNTSLCGIAHGLVNQVDTTTIFNQYQSWFEDYSETKANEFTVWSSNLANELENWINGQETDFISWREFEQNKFLSWFSTIKEILDTNAAGNLQLQIDEHKDSSMPHKYLDTSNNKIYKYGLQRNPILNCVAFIYEEE